MRAARHTGDSYAVREADGIREARDISSSGAQEVCVKEVCVKQAISKRVGLWSSLLVLSCMAMGCQPGIGDACSSALQCSTSGSRLCDLTQPHGYCTLAGCDEGTCPTDSVCVTFWPRVPMESDALRLGTNYCMSKCKSHSDCRNSDGYTCLGQSDFGAMDESKVLGNPNQRFCAVRGHAITVDAGVLPDAAANMSVGPDE